MHYNIEIGVREANPFLSYVVLATVYQSNREQNRAPIVMLEVAMSGRV